VVLCVQYQVIGRYVFNDTPTWAEAVAVLLVLYVTMLRAWRWACAMPGTSGWSRCSCCRPRQRA
jgi:hypothetical protein